MVLVVKIGHEHPFRPHSWHPPPSTYVAAWSRKQRRVLRTTHRPTSEPNQPTRSSPNRRPATEQSLVPPNLPSRNRDTGNHYVAARTQHFETRQITPDTSEQMRHATLISDTTPAPLCQQQRRNKLITPGKPSTVVRRTPPLVIFVSHEHPYTQLAGLALVTHRNRERQIRCSPADTPSKLHQQRPRAQT